MQKVMLCLQRPDESAEKDWNQLIVELSHSYSDSFAACAYAIKDEGVAPANLLELKYTTHPNDAVISIWVDNAFQLNDFYTAAAKLGKFQAYGVMESSAIPYQFELGRVEGMCQIAFIRKPAAQARADWLDAWLGDHTRVAIDTQSNFAYRQNVISAGLPLKQSEKPIWPLMDAIVEENFPSIAMTSREAFFDAEGDPEKFARHQQIMMQSCFKFIDFECFDCVPMSQYIIKTA